MDVFNRTGLVPRTYPFKNSIVIIPVNEEGTKVEVLPSKVYTLQRARRKSLGHITAVFHKKCAFDNQNFSIPFNCTAAELFTESNPEMYNGNLYIPYNDCVVKLIFHPDSKNDPPTVQTVLKEYPAMACVMDSNSSSLWENNSGDSFDKFIGASAASSLRSICITEDGMVNAFNYDEVAMTSDNETVYGIFNSERYALEGDDVTYNYIFAQRAGSFGKDSISIKYISTGHFSCIRADRDGNYSFFLDKNGRKWWYVFDRTCKRRFSMDITGYSKILSLNNYTYIDSKDEEKRVFVVLAVLYERVYRLEWNTATDKLYRTVLQDITAKPTKLFSLTNNSAALIRNSAKNAIYFDLNLASQSAFAKNHIRIKWNIETISKGWYNINAMADLEQAVFEVRINDRILERVRYDKGLD